MWRQPTSDATYRGFDAELISLSAKGDGQAAGQVHMSAKRLELLAPSFSQPTANLLTTALNDFSVSFDVVAIAGQSGSAPLVAEIWSPVTRTASEIVFRSGPMSILSEQVEGGAPGRGLRGGVVTHSDNVGRFQLGSATTLTITVHKKLGVLNERVAGADGIRTLTVGGETLRQLFNSPRLSLTLSVEPGPAPTSVAIENYRLTLLHESFIADRIADRKANTLMVIAGVVGAVLLFLSLCEVARENRAPIRRTVAFVMGRLRCWRPQAIFAGALVTLVVVPNLALFHVGSHPYDMASEKVYAYVGSRSGLDELYYLPNVVGLPAAQGGVPYAAATFPYEPVLGYFFATVGLFGRVSDLGLNNAGLEYLIKSANLLFVLVDSFFVYLISRRIGVSRNWSLAATALFLFNPAVWFSASIWGQTHVVSLAFILAAIWLVETNMPFLAWLTLAMGVLTRPQMVVFGLLLALVLVLKFPWRVSIRAVSTCVIAGFVLLLPFTLKIAPGLTVDVLKNTIVLQHTTSSVDPATVSLDAYTVWPLVTLLLHGAAGLERIFTPSAQTFLGGLTYQAAGEITVALAIVGLSAGLVMRRRTLKWNGRYIPLLALGIAIFLMFITGVVATHFLLALPLLILCRRWMNTGSYFFVVLLWTVTTLVPMYGDMGNVIARLDDTMLSPLHNDVTRFFVELYSWDPFITFATLANVAVVVWMSIVTFRPTFQPRRIESAA
jgi:hypothetical protein